MVKTLKMRHLYHRMLILTKINGKPEKKKKEKKEKEKERKKRSMS